MIFYTKSIIIKNVVINIKCMLKNPIFNCLVTKIVLRGYNKVINDMHEFWKIKGKSKVCLCEEMDNFRTKNSSKFSFKLLLVFFSNIWDNKKYTEWGTIVHNVCTW